MKVYEISGLAAGIDAGAITEPASIPAASPLISNICYVDLGSSHASLSVLLGTTGGGNAVGLMKVYEISGLAAGIDAGSVMAPGNSFGQLNYSTGNSSSYGHLGGLKFIPSAGSNTASYTQTGSTTPVIGVAAFDGGVGSTLRHRAQVI